MHPAAAIEATGTALYGRWWRAPLARSLRRPGADKPGIDRRLLNHWMDGTPGRPVPSWVPDALVQLAQQEALAGKPPRRAWRTQSRKHAPPRPSQTASHTGRHPRG